MPCEGISKGSTEQKRDQTIYGSEPSFLTISPLSPQQEDRVLHGHGKVHYWKPQELCRIYRPRKAKPSNPPAATPVSQQWAGQSAAINLCHSEERGQKWESACSFIITLHYSFQKAHLLFIRWLTFVHLSFLHFFIFTHSYVSFDWFIGANMKGKWFFSTINT